MATRSQLVDELLKLPAADRADAARTLLESLDDHEEPADVERAWHDEIASRVDEIERGAVTLEDGPAAVERLRERARARLQRRRARPPRGTGSIPPRSPSSTQRGSGTTSNCRA